MKKGITAYVNKFIQNECNSPDGRYKSWEFCYKFFQKEFDQQDWDKAALMLAFYLASWGMYRGSSFLLQYTYTIHIPALKIIFSTKYLKLQKALPTEDKDISLLFTLIKELKVYYFCKQRHIRPNITSFKEVSDTLISKIIMGVLGNMPAYDRFVKSGLKKSHLSQKMSPESYKQLLLFYRQNKNEINSLYKEHCIYPPMKILDMYFWSLGQESASYSNSQKIK